MTERANVVTVSITDLRSNLKKYLALSKEKQVFVHLGNDEAVELVPTKPLTETDQYFSNKRVRKHLDRSIKQAEKGEVKPFSVDEAIEMMKL